MNAPHSDLRGRCRVEVVWLIALIQSDAGMAAASDARVIALDSGHSPFLTQPDEFADILSSLD